MSFYTSLNGLKNAQTDLGVISHNIANAETNGFKKSRTEFADIVVGSAFTNPRMIIGVGATVESIAQNFSLGPVEQTGSALDMAIGGDGFFTTRNVITNQLLYTRNGGMTVDGDGFINDGSNNRLQVFPTDATGAITSNTPTDAQIPASNGVDAAGNPIEFAGITVGADGSVIATYADASNLSVGKVILASFIAPQGLKQIGSSNWVTTGISGAPSYGQPGTGQYGSLLSGAVERSNVDIAEELVSLITAQRNFQANAKAIDTSTQITQTVIQLRT
ncbi:MAG: flagellar biosynthesis protein FlgE [Novosphingobium sp. 28-62-57]|uniref:flagellar hook-basal body complex protein n=1 Tax=unclassified Novosphingobium TaxID=2644732 RepID=UPI000BC7B04E|nr:MULTISPECIES: flagellar hook-basal body complex protein [unclassified Novosphingobium]OYW47570.1 MAG: flagellar biosynthesis protein FlgE [Novosphingobium sp. 12-63-9]OYZ39785.1 MAG: flagellar biosynthesis protein FlgE [Novosphingobium sp. 16-62-11]OZA37656.1 MAG: flagellar biosynthesis protein FlgE [Novosphingobium sp. 17-62-9]OYZ08801.1 MAG: flagellar biosynthesis protein FlgE [Novosphingobium sp. 28-62-57]HQS70197.1 flagellar hook-basal body complex protein [Novosphingobium sp.]